MRRGSDDQAFPAYGCARDAMMSFDAAGQATALTMIAKRAGGGLCLSRLPAPFCAKKKRRGEFRATF